jgi:YVTN family beta-propeller protein
VKFTPGGERVLVSCAESNELIAYDARSREERKRLAIDAAPIGILVTPDGATAYVAITGADKVTVIDLDDMTVSGEIRTGREPDGMAWASWDGE